MATVPKKKSAMPELSVGEQRKLRTSVQGRHGRACPRSRVRGMPRTPAQGGAGWADLRSRKRSKTVSGEGGVSRPASQICHPEGFP